MTQSQIHNSFTAGEISPSLWGRTDLAKYSQGASTMRNMFGNYRGGASSRAGGKYVLQALQAGDRPPPRPITFQFSINQGFALDFGDRSITRTVTDADDNGVGVIRLTLNSTAGLFDEETVVISGVVGTTEANGTWKFSVIDSTHIDLLDSTFVNPYTSGGTAVVANAGYMRVISDGGFVVETSKAITGATQANPAVITIAGHGYLPGDWVLIENMGGMTNFNSLTWIVDTVPDANHVTLTDLFGNIVDSRSFTAYTAGGTSSRIYTAASPYSAVDLPFLKFTQSANTMSLCLVNQETGTEYLTYDLTRVSDTNWTFTEVNFTATILAPTGLGGTPHSSTTTDTYYGYVVTAVDAVTGEESIASSNVVVKNNNISVNAGSNNLAWTGSSGAGSYNVYGATPSYKVTTPSGVLYGYLGTSTGLNFVDSNIIADFTQTPPLHANPFSGAGNNPGDVAYFQQRRYYGYTLNNRDTYYASKPGLYTNFDNSIPVNDSDSFSGAPWAQQINGIQAMIPMNPGLIILTGLGAWLLQGSGTAGSAVTASSQTATAQAYNGCHSHIQPLVVNLDILYVQSKGSIIRDLSFNFFQNIFTGTDLTVLSNHLFNYRQVQQWAYAEEPFKVAWVVRDDGVLISLTYLKEQDVYTWARHDTNGFYVGVTSVTEPPIDAVYTVVKRYVQGAWRYYYERFDNRNWVNVEDCFCVDAGLSYPMTFPDATLTPAAASGTSNISSTFIITGGSGYTAPTVTAIDQTGSGTGATFSVTLSGGVITAITPVTQGSLYIPGQTILQITDATGSGAKAQPVITNIVSFAADANVFSAGNVGDVIRIGNNNASSLANAGVAISGGGKAVITSYVSPTEVMANITEPITAVVPDDPNFMPVPVASNQWSMTTPTSVVSGLNHLEGLQVTGLADGSVIPPQTVVGGAISLAAPASAITVGLPFTAQLQTLKLESQGGETQRGRRKSIVSVTAIVEASRGFSVGSNQPDASAQPNQANVPWTDMKEIKERDASVQAGSSVPLFTGDLYENVPGEWSMSGQTAFMQQYPLPLNVLACVTSWESGDSQARDS